MRFPVLLMLAVLPLLVACDQLPDAGHPLRLAQLSESELIGSTEQQLFEIAGPASRVQDRVWYDLGEGGAPLGRALPQPGDPESAIWVLQFKEGRVAESCLERPGERLATRPFVPEVWRAVQPRERLAMALSPGFAERLLGLTRVEVGLLLGPWSGAACCSTRSRTSARPTSRCATGAWPSC